MPVSVSYPGVYIEEIPSGVRTIANVATSITAFVGKAVRGPAGDPVTITSFADFERLFGGLHRDFTLGYAVRDFFLNGGAIAIVVRLYKPTSNKGSKSSFNITNLSLEAANEGAWGQKLRVRIEKKAATDPNLAAAAARLGVGPTDLFDVVVRDGNTGRIETFLNLTTKESARRADRVLKSESSLIRSTQALPAATTPTAAAGALTDADVWTDATKSTPAQSTATTEAVDSAAVGATEFKASCPTPGTATCPTMCIRMRSVSAPVAGPS
jgi:phage tail sheath protein FI